MKDNAVHHQLYVFTADRTDKGAREHSNRFACSLSRGDT